MDHICTERPYLACSGTSLAFVLLRILLKAVTMLVFLECYAFSCLSSVCHKDIAQGTEPMADIMPSTGM